MQVPVDISCIFYLPYFVRKSSKKPFFSPKLWDLPTLCKGKTFLHSVCNDLNYFYFTVQLELGLHTVFKLNTYTKPCLICEPVKSKSTESVKLKLAILISHNEWHFAGKNDIAKCLWFSVLWAYVLYIWWHVSVMSQSSALRNTWIFKPFTIQCTMTSSGLYMRLHEIIWDYMGL